MNTEKETHMIARKELNNYVRTGNILWARLVSFVHMLINEPVAIFLRFKLRFHKCVTAVRHTASIATWSDSHSVRRMPVPCLWNLSNLK